MASGTLTLQKLLVFKVESKSSKELISKEEALNVTTTKGDLVSVIMATCPRTYKFSRVGNILSMVLPRSPGTNSSGFLVSYNLLAFTGTVLDHRRHQVWIPSLSCCCRLLQ